MMNSIPSSKMQLLKFAAVLPLLIFMSVVFRQSGVMAQKADTAVSITAKSGIYIKGDFQDGKQLIIVDGMIQPQGFNMNNIKPNDITTISVLKGDAAIKKHGQKGANGVLEVFTNLPLCLVNGKIQMKTSSIDQLVPAEDIKSVHVLKGNEATGKYGESGKNGVVEITTKGN